MPTFANTIDNNEIYAKRAECDAAGSDIQTTYATKSEVNIGLASKQDTVSDLSTIRSGAAAGATAVQPGDIVAGPGIAIDNPDGNTLRVSNAMSEVVLWDGNGTGASTCTLSEHPTNFEYLIVYAGESSSFIGCYILRSGNTNYRISSVAGGSNVWLDFFFLTRTNLTITVTADKRINFGGVESTTASYSVTIGDKNVLYKVVGVNRIANN